MTKRRLQVVTAAVLATLAGCASSTTIMSRPQGAKLYLNGEPVGYTPYTMTDTKIVGSTTAVRLELPGYEVTNVWITRNEQFDGGACFGGVFLLFPFLWIQGYNPVHTFEMRPMGWGPPPGAYPPGYGYQPPPGYAPPPGYGYAPPAAYPQPPAPPPAAARPRATSRRSGPSPAGRRAAAGARAPAGQRAADPARACACTRRAPPPLKRRPAAHAHSRMATEPCRRRVQRRERHAAA